MTRLAPILETRGLMRRFGGVVAVDRVDFRLEANELRCVIGPNGAGKSTFFKCLNGQLRPTDGTVLFEGVEITRAEPFRVARMGVATKTQVPNVFDGLSARENIWIAASKHAGNKSAAQAATDEALARADLASVEGTHVGQLAHGVRQWVELAMILASRPKLVLLDEPTAGMTAVEIARVGALLDEIRQTAAIIVVEHDMKFVRSIASTVTVFHNGRILLEDHVTSVLRDSRVRDVYLGKETSV